MAEPTRSHAIAALIATRCFFADMGISDFARLTPQEASAWLDVPLEELLPVYELLDGLVDRERVRRQ